MILFLPSSSLLLSPSFSSSPPLFLTFPSSSSWFLPLFKGGSSLFPLAQFCTLPHSLLFFSSLSSFSRLNHTLCVLKECMVFIQRSFPFPIIHDSSILWLPQRVIWPNDIWFSLKAQNAIFFNFFLKGDLQEEIYTFLHTHSKSVLPVSFARFNIAHFGMYVC